MTEENFIKEIASLVGKYPSGFFNSIAIAQACLESFFGRSELAVKAHNYFGIKSGGDWKGDVYYKNTQEDDGKGNMSTIKAGFRKYKNMEESVKDHAGFLTSTPWRAEYYKDVINAKTPELQARALTGTYATDTRYKVKLMDIINKYNLEQYDEGDNKMEISKPKIIDRRSKALGYPDRTKLAGNRRSVSGITHIGVHYTATTNGSIQGHENFWRNNRGWNLGGYSYYIDRAGNIYQNYDHAVRTNGVAGHNTRTLNFSVEASHKNNYTPAQLASRTHLILWLMQELNVPASRVLQHKEFSGQATSCAGYSTSEANALRNNLAKKAKSGNVGGSVATSAGAYKVKDEKAVIHLTENIKVRDKAHYEGELIRTAQKGERIAYTEVYEGNDYRWVKSGNEFIPYRPLNSKDAWVEFEKLPDKEKQLQKYQGRGKGFRDLKMGDTLTVRAGHERWLHVNRKHMEPAKRDYAGETDKVSKIADVNIGYSHKSYYLERMKVWILEQDVVETRQSPGQPQIKEQPEGFMIEDVDLEESPKEAKPENLGKNEVILDGKVWVITEKE